MTTEMEKISAQFDGLNLHCSFTTANQAEGELSAFAYEARKINQDSLEATQKQAFLLAENLWKNGAPDAAAEFGRNYLICYPTSLSE